MELLETNDLKAELLKKSAMHREELEEEVKLISERTQKALTNALIIGGTLAASYFIARQLSGGSGSRKGKKRKVKIVRAVEAAPEQVVQTEVVPQSETPGIVSHIGTAIAGQALAFLLNVAKEKLSEYLEAKTEAKEK
jgi:Na+-translocating ferredoxin:NAD+ oxidoreductase RnfG subunit